LHKKKHDLKIQDLRLREQRVKVEAESELKKAQTLSGLKLKMSKLQAQREAQATELKTREELEEANAKRKILQYEAEADKKKCQAEAEQVAVESKANAEADGILKMAESEAKGARLIGSAYKANPGYLKLEREKISSSVLRMRAFFMATALKLNDKAMVPDHLQRELAEINQEFAMGNEKAS